MWEPLRISVEWEGDGEASPTFPCDSGGMEKSLESLSGKFFGLCVGFSYVVLF